LPGGGILSFGVFYKDLQDYIVTTRTTQTFPNTGDIYSEARTSVDFGSRCFISDAVTVYLNVKNLTDTPLKCTEGQSGRPIQRETYRETLQFGVEATF